MTGSSLPPHEEQVVTAGCRGQLFQTEAAMRIARPAYIAESFSNVNLPTRTTTAAATPTRNVTVIAVVRSLLRQRRRRIDDPVLVADAGDFPEPPRQPAMTEDHTVARSTTA
jgi:hypothetical protein